MKRQPNAYGIDVWKQFLEAEMKRMQNELEHVSDPKKRGECKDQLIWLRQQMAHFEKPDHFEHLRASFEWVVHNFNERLKPKQRFKDRP